MFFYVKHVMSVLQLGLHGCGADWLVACQSESYEGSCRTIQALNLLTRAQTAAK